MVEFTRRFEASNGASLWFSGRDTRNGTNYDSVTVTTDLPEDVDPDIMGWSVDANAAREFAGFFIRLANALDYGARIDPVDTLGVEEIR